MTTYVSTSGEPLLCELIPGTREVIAHIKRLWPDQAERLLNGPARECVAFLNTHTSIQVDARAPIGFITP